MDTSPPESSPISTAPLRFCPACEYDLRGHPPGAPCPECGQPSPTNHIELRGYSGRPQPGSLIAGNLWFFPSAFSNSDYITVAACLAFAATVQYLLHRFPPKTHALTLTPSGVAIGPLDAPPLREQWHPGCKIALLSRWQTSHIQVSVLKNGSRNNGAAPLTQNLFISLPPELAAATVAQCNTWITAATSRPPETPDLHRTCPGCQQLIPDITWNFCPHCQRDISALPATLFILRDRPTRTISSWLIANAGNLTISLFFAIKMVIRPSTINITLALIMLLILALTALYTRFGNPSKPWVFRVAPAGYEFSHPDDRVNLSPWNPNGKYSFEQIGFGTQLFKRSFKSLLPLEQHTLRLSNTSAAALTKAIRTWTTQPTPAPPSR